MQSLEPTTSRRALAGTLRSLQGGLPSAVIGFDGFIDEMIRLVGERSDLETYAAIPTITAFGDLVSKAAGRSSLREIVVTDVHPGGCAINMGDGLAALGVPVDAFATLGAPPHPAFAAITRRFRTVESWGSQPGRTLAFEFSDGKVMFSSVSQLAELTPAHARARLAAGRFAAACAEAGLIALTDWTLYPHMTAVWRLLQKEVFAGLTQRPRFFIDLVDPSGRTAAEIAEMLSLLVGFETAGTLTLGLNGNEANIAARILNLPLAQPECAESVQIQAAALREALGISEVVIHQIKVAVAADARGTVALVGPYCAQPVKSTGAGDRFNAGYALGLMLDLDAGSRLLLGCGSSGYFVRHGRSPSLDELSAFLDQDAWWAAG